MHLVPQAFTQAEVFLRTSFRWLEMLDSPFCSQAKAVSRHLSLPARLPSCTRRTREQSPEQEGHWVMLKQSTSLSV